jgi:hypothetical protein
MANVRVGRGDAGDPQATLHGVVFDILGEREQRQPSGGRLALAEGREGHSRGDHYYAANSSIPMRGLARRSGGRT